MQRACHIWNYIVWVWMKILYESEFESKIQDKFIQNRPLNPFSNEHDRNTVWTDKWSYRLRVAVHPVGFFYGLTINIENLFSLMARLILSTVSVGTRSTLSLVSGQPGSDQFRVYSFHCYSSRSGRKLNCGIQNILRFEGQFSKRNIRGRIQRKGIRIR